MTQSGNFTITKTRKKDGNILFIGGDGRRLYKNIAINLINNHKCSFFVGSGDLAVAIHVYNDNRLRSAANGEWNDNLDSLPYIKLD